MPRHIEARGHAGGAADDPVGALAGSDAGQQRIPGLPYRRHGLVAPVLEHLVIDAIRGAAQGEFAQGDQIALAEKVLDGAFGLVRKIDLAFLQALQQLVGWQIDQDDFVGNIEDMVGHGFPDADAGDAADDIVEGFQVLDIHRGINIDPGRQQFLDVLPALRMTRTGDVGVGQFVHQDQCGLAHQGAVDVEFPQHFVAVRDVLQGQPLQSFEHGFGFPAAVGLDDADDHVPALLQLLARRREHGVGFADTGRSAEEYLQLAARGPKLIFLDPVEELVGIGAGVAHAKSSFKTQSQPGRSYQRPFQRVCAS